MKLSRYYLEEFRYGKFHILDKTDNLPVLAADEPLVLTDCDKAVEKLNELNDEN